MKQGWEIKKLGEVCEVIGGGTPSKKNPKFYEGDILWATVRDMKSQILSDTEFKITKDAVKNSSTNIIPKGNVIIATRVGLGKICLLEKDTAINQDLRGVIPTRVGSLSVNFLFHWLKSISHIIIAEGTGATVQGVKLPFIKGLKIPLPPLPDQQRIVSILDEAFAAIDKAKANAEQNLKNAKVLFESYLQEVFGPSTGSRKGKRESWEVKNLGEVANTNGRIGWRGLTAKEYTEQGPLFLSVHSLNYGDYVDFKDAFHISQERYDESPEIMLQKDDILICKDGAGIGKLGIIPDLPDFATINSSLLLIRCKSSVLTKYLYYNLLSPFFQSIVNSRLSGATTPHLYQRDIVTFPILLPSKTEQQTIVHQLDALREETQKLEAIYQKKLTDLEELKKSILQKAFAGELG